jgi:hypothetical protein
MHTSLLRSTSTPPRGQVNVDDPERQCVALLVDGVDGQLEQLEQLEQLDSSPVHR